MRERQPTSVPPWRQSLEDYRRAFDAYHADPASLVTTAFLDRAIIRLEEASREPGLFELGLVALSNGAVAELSRNKHLAEEFLIRHKHGDWGNVSEDEAGNNLYAIARDYQINSRYETRSGSGLWVVTSGLRRVDRPHQDHRGDCRDNAQPKQSKPRPIQLPLGWMPGQERDDVLPIPVHHLKPVAQDLLPVQEVVVVRLVEDKRGCADRGADPRVLGERLLLLEEKIPHRRVVLEDPVLMEQGELIGRQLLQVDLSADLDTQEEVDDPADGGAGNGRGDHREPEAPIVRVEPAEAGEVGRREEETGDQAKHPPPGLRHPARREHVVLRPPLPR